jgi:hypothetical protein
LAAACGPDANLSSSLSSDDADAGGSSDLAGDLFDTVPLGDAGDDEESADPDDDFGMACEQDFECLSNYCVQYQDGHVCTELCAGPDSCPEGWACRLLENSGADAVRICVPRPDTLCSPCENNTDCAMLSDMCIQLGTSQVCGRDCSQGQVCPDDYTCSTVQDSRHGGTAVSLTDTCACTVSEGGPPLPAGQRRRGLRRHRDCQEPPVGRPAALTSARGRLRWPRQQLRQPNRRGPPQPRLQQHPNAIGSCPGTERCEGLEVGCATPPPVEQCDGLDNDCSGGIDGPC